MKEKKIIYEPHPVSAERKAELVKQGFKILDAVFEPQAKARELSDSEKPRTRRRKDD